MFERFTDRARKVMALTNQEAQRLGHEYIGTEHILLGLIKEGSGIGTNALSNLGLNPERILAEVEKLLLGGPHVVSVGKLPQTPRAKKVIEYAIEEARALNHRHVGTEHLLLGLLREQEGVAAQVLMNFGLSVAAVRQEVSAMLGAGSEAVSHQAAGSPSAPDHLYALLRTIDEGIQQLEGVKDEAVKQGAYERAAEVRDLAEAFSAKRSSVLQGLQSAFQSLQTVTDELNQVLRNLKT